MVSIIEDMRSRGFEFQNRPYACFGFHGTSRLNADSIILSQLFDLSRSNEKNWFGPGAYFYDDHPHSGTEFAMCWAKYRRYPHPTVLRAELKFVLLLDVDDSINGRCYFELLRLIRGYCYSMGRSDIEHIEALALRIMGNELARSLGSDGVGWSQFPLGELREPSSRRQHGFAVKKVEVIRDIRLADEVASKSATA